MIKIAEARELFMKSMDDYRIQKEERGELNPFFEKVKRGRKSLETRIRKDFFDLWEKDNTQKGFLESLAHIKTLNSLKIKRG